MREVALGGCANSASGGSPAAFSAIGHMDTCRDRSKGHVSSLSYCFYSSKDTWTHKTLCESFHMGTNANVFTTCFIHIHFNVISKKQVVKTLALDSLGKKDENPSLICPCVHAPRAAGSAP